MAFQTPVLFLVFNRPDLTRRVFERIREVKPKYLYVAADGPRQNQIEDIERCKVVRRLILDGIDWDCEVKTLFRDKNLGCGKAVSEAITWFFEHVDEGIILEDDCLVDLSFFSFAEAMLKRYRYEEKIFHISANSTSSSVIRYDYAFSIYPLIWGWASWRRAWEKYNFKIDKSLIEKVTNIVFKDKVRKDYWVNHFELLESEKINTWDYQWVFACLKNNALCITPKFNLVTNIGFDERATHTHEINSSRSNQKSFQLKNWEYYPSKLNALSKLVLSVENEIFSLPAPLKFFDKLKLRFINAYSTYFNL